MKDLNYYLNLNYKYVIFKKNSVYYIEYTDLPGCMSHGDTLTEALQSSEDAKKYWFLTALEKNMNIPEPYSK